MWSCTPDFHGFLSGELELDNDFNCDKDMEKRENQERVPVSNGMKVCRVLGVVLVVAAIGYLVWRGDFDSKGIVGYVDDCFVFMAAYTFARGSFMRPERRYIRRQMYMLSSLFALLGLCWIIMLALMK
jgi:hypothetical protein